MDSSRLNKDDSETGGGEFDGNNETTQRENDEQVGAKASKIKKKIISIQKKDIKNT